MGDHICTENTIVIRLIDSRRVALVSPESYERVRRHLWRECGQHIQSQSCYAGATIDGESVLMHRLIVGAPKGVIVDHISGITLDNTVNNLRSVRTLENNWNRPQHVNRGIEWSPCKQVLEVYITVNGKVITVGCARTMTEARNQRREAEVMHYGMVQRDNNVITFDDTAIMRQLRLATTKNAARKLLHK